MSKSDPALPLPEPRETYAFERSCGMTPTEACRRAAGEKAVDNGSPTKWERMSRVQRRIHYLRTLGQTDQMLAAKRARLEERLQLAAFGNIFDFSELTPKGDPMIRWDRVVESPYGVIVSSFKFDKDTGRLVDFDRDNALQAIAQLRDMNGFKAPERHAFTGADGGPIIIASDKQRARALAAFVAKTKASARPAS